jgi:hypothetical protein
MSEVDETSQRIRALTMTLLSGALAAAQAAQMLRARKAREATKAAAAEQAQLRRQLQADRAAAAVLWKRAMDPRLASTNPEHLAQAWSSAVAWETLDPRAAGVARRLDERLRAAGVHPEAARAARETDDYAALALLLARSERPTAAAGPQGEPQRDDYQGEQHQEIEDFLDRDAGEILDTVAIIEGALDPETAGEVLAAEALPALEAELARAAERGHDPEEMLSRVTAQRSLGDAVDPAAVLHYRMQRALNLEPDSINNPAEFGQDAWWLLDEATLDRSGAAHDRADADAERWAEHAAAGVATDPHQDPVTRAADETAAGGHASEAGRLELDATALSDRARDSTAATANGASELEVGPELGFTGGSDTARLAAESYPHSIRTALARDSNPRRAPKARGRRAGQQTEQDRGR